MCCCAKPNVNGELGYSWDGKNVSTRPVAAPTITDRDTLLFDEPGRCGGMDSHCHHYRLVKDIGISLLVRHGGAMCDQCEDSRRLLRETYLSALPPAPKGNR